MKQLNNQKSEVYLSTYDNSDLLLPVSEEHKSMENVCVAVKFGDILIKISPANTCKCSWYKAMEKHKDELIHPAYWQMVGAVYNEVNQVIEMLRHDFIDIIWTNTETEPYVWTYFGPLGLMLADNKGNSYSVRATKVFKIEG